jgi:high-affinity nickel-transport protein
MNSSQLPQDLLELALVIVLMGIRHGFDPDHLAAIDGMTRYNARDRPRLARLAGVFFSIGHGIVILSVALSVATLARKLAPPQWLDTFGTWLAISVLIALALINIASALRAPHHQMVHLAGWRTSLFSRLLKAGSPAMMLGVGIVFALSFETLSQASLFAMVATKHHGWQPALILASLFVLGMIITDGVNGWFISRLIRRSDETARIASRVMALAVSGVSLLVAGLGIASELFPRVEEWRDGKDTWFGAAVIAVVVFSYLGGQLIVRRGRHVGGHAKDHDGAGQTP